MKKAKTQGVHIQFVVCCQSQQKHSLLFEIAKQKVSKCLLFISQVSLTRTLAGSEQTQACG